MSPAKKRYLNRKVDFTEFHRYPVKIKVVLHSCKQQLCSSSKVQHFNKQVDPRLWNDRRRRRRFFFCIFILSKISKPSNVWLVYNDSHPFHFVILLPFWSSSFYPQLGHLMSHSWVMKLAIYHGDTYIDNAYTYIHTYIHTYILQHGWPSVYGPLAGTTEVVVVLLEHTH